jgi:hypothetical protein
VEKYNACLHQRYYVKETCLDISDRLSHNLKLTYKRMRHTEEAAIRKAEILARHGMDTPATVTAKTNQKEEMDPQPITPKQIQFIQTPLVNVPVKLTVKLKAAGVGTAKGRFGGLPLKNK